MEFFSELISETPALVTIYKVVRGIVIVLDVVFLFLVFYSIAKLLKYRPKFVYSPHKWQKHVRKKKEPKLSTPVVTSAWSKVQSKLRDGTPDSLRLAIIEADGIVGDVLKRLGLAGETFAERLGRLKPERFATIDNLWDAHRIRNNLVHTPDFNVPLPKAEEAIGAYEAFLKEVKAL